MGLLRTLGSFLFVCSIASLGSSLITLTPARAALSESDQTGLQKLLDELFQRPGSRSGGLSNLNPPAPVCPPTLSDLFNRLVPPAPTPPAPEVKISLGKKLSSGTHLTGYYPKDDAMQGGFKNAYTGRLFTLEDFLAGKAPYVTVALDWVGSMGNHHKKFVCIPGLEKAYAKDMKESVRKKYGGRIPFKVMDTGGRFRNKKWHKMDICHKTRSDAWDKRTQGNREIYDCDEDFKKLIPPKITRAGVEIE